MSAWIEGLGGTTAEYPAAGFDCCDGGRRGCGGGVVAVEEALECREATCRKEVIVMME